MPPKRVRRESTKSESKSKDALKTKLMNDIRAFKETSAHLLPIIENILNKTKEGDEFAIILGDNEKKAKARMNNGPLDLFLKVFASDANIIKLDINMTTSQYSGKDWGTNPSFSVVDFSDESRAPMEDSRAEDMKVFTAFECEREYSESGRNDIYWTIEPYCVVATRASG